MTFKGESTQNVRKLARKQGMRTLFEDGMIKALKGLTTLEEVLRITQREMPQPERSSSEPRRRRRPRPRTRSRIAGRRGDARGDVRRAIGSHLVHSVSDPTTSCD